MPGSERIASTWIDKHDTNRGIKSPFPIWFPLHCAANLLVVFYKKGKGRDWLNASLCNIHEGKVSRAGVWASILRWVHPICHPWNYENHWWNKSTCFARFSWITPSSALCQTQSCAVSPAMRKEPVHLARLMAPFSLDLDPPRAQYTCEHTKEMEA